MKEIMLVPREIIEQKIHILRGKKVMLDKDLAQLYEVITRDLNKAVKRNIERFPEDFMFQLNKREFQNLMFQIGTSSWGGTRKLPLAFTEQGVAMLSSVLNSKKAIQVNIQIIRTFYKLREMVVSNKELNKRIDDLERKYDKRFRVIFENIKLMIQEDAKPKVEIGFRERKK
jgi:hypothetical protein